VGHRAVSDGMSASDNVIQIPDDVNAR